MSFFNDEQKLTKHFLDAWDDVSNEYRAIPVDAPSKRSSPDSSGEIVNFRVMRSPSRPYAIGGSRRNFGSVLVQIKLVAGSGAGKISKIADVIAGFYVANNKPIRISPITCGLSSANGPFEEDTFVMMNVDVPWHSDYNL
jgi:hypothetical protein